MLQLTKINKITNMGLEIKSNTGAKDSESAANITRNQHSKFATCILNVYQQQHA